MKVLFLDDMKDRHEAFEKKFEDRFEITHVWGYEDCVDALIEQDFDLVFLDHDLSETAIMCDPDVIDERTGTDVVKHIVQTIEPNIDAPGFVIHSLNPVGRKRMTEMLRDSGFDVREYPFSWLV